MKSEMTASCILIKKKKKTYAVYIIKNFFKGDTLEKC